MQKFLLLCGLLAMLGLASLPVRADFAPGPFGMRPPFPQLYQPRPLAPPIFNYPTPLPFAPFYRWQIVTVQVPGQAGTFILLVDTISGTSFILRPDAREPSGYSWQWLPRP